MKRLRTLLSISALACGSEALQVHGDVSERECHTVEVVRACAIIRNDTVSAIRAQGFLAATGMTPSISIRADGHDETIAPPECACKENVDFLAILPLPPGEKLTGSVQVAVKASSHCKEEVSHFEEKPKNPYEDGSEENPFTLGPCVEEKGAGDVSPGCYDNKATQDNEACGAKP